MDNDTDYTERPVKYPVLSGYKRHRMGPPPELKFFDTSDSDTTVAAGGTFLSSVCLIPQGVTEATRIGRKCTIKHIEWRYEYSLPELDAGTTPNRGDTVRVIMYIDHQCNGAIATVLGILETDAKLSFYNLSERGRFTILYDVLETLNYTGQSSDGAGLTSQSFVMRDTVWLHKCNIPIEYNSTAGALTEITTNNIGILLVGSNGVGGLFSNVRVRFTDN